MEEIKNENDREFIDELQNHICNLIAELEKYDPTSEEYCVIKDAVEKFSAITVKVKETEFKAEVESESLSRQMEMKRAEIEAAKIAKEAEVRLKNLELCEDRRWHNIDMWLRIATILTGVVTTGFFGWTAWTQARMNYVDNVYDTSSSSRMILNAIGNRLKANP